jgi:hypothetical protein
MYHSVRPTCSATVALVACASVALAACASAPSANVRPTAHDRIIVTSDPAGTVADMSLVRPDRVGSFLVPLPAARLWPLLPAAFAELGMPEPATDVDRMAAAVQGHTLGRVLGDARLADLFDCGADMAGRIADTHRLRIDVETWLGAVGGSTAVHTRAEAVALSPERSGRIPCATTGLLERRIADTLERIAAR